MGIHELVIEMTLLERRLTLYEEKYGILSEDFYSALTAGKLSHFDAFDETRADFSRWKGIYETWLRRKSFLAAFSMAASIENPCFSKVNTSTMSRISARAKRAQSLLARISSGGSTRICPIESLSGKI